MSEKIIEQIVNIKDEIDDILDDRIVTEITDNNKQNTKKITSVKSIIDYITDELSKYFTIEDANDYTKKEDLNQYVTNSTLENNYTSNNTLEENYITKEEANTLLSDVTTNFEGHSFKYPKPTTDIINNIIEAGYYQYIDSNDDAQFICEPDTVFYRDGGLIRVERTNDFLIQYVHSTSLTNSGYQIDGKEFVRHGYLTTNSETGDTIPAWSQWRVHHLPYKQRDDLLDIKGENVDDNAFHIYEHTTGYIIEWKQRSTNAKYVLPMNQYTYADVYTLKKALPIQNPMVFSNFIGHIDIKIINEANDNGETVTKVKVRSSSNKGEYVVGVDNTYFIPRTN